MKISRFYIKLCRYIFKRKFLKIFSGALKGYWFSTERSYEYLLGNYEDDTVMETFRSWCTADAVLYDIGCNAGYYSLVANLSISNGKIYAIEPLPQNIELLREHIALNKKFFTNDNIIVCPFAIADAEKEISFSNSNEQTDGNTYISTSRVFKNATKINVQCYSVDGLVAKGYVPPTVLKIDVEGAEYDVLTGAVDTIKKYRPNILLATHDIHFPGVKDKCVAFLESLHYTLQHTGGHNKNESGLDDFIAVPQENKSY